MASLFGVFLHGDELPGDICHHGVGVVAGFDAGRGEETVRDAIQFGLRENDRRLGINDVGVEIGAQLATTPCVIARLPCAGRAATQARRADNRAAVSLKQFLVFAGEFRMSIGEGLQIAL